MTIFQDDLRRERLLDFAGQPPEPRILFVSAPAGFGKSIFAKQWLESFPEPGAMVLLDERDNTVEGVCRKLREIPCGLCMEKAREISAFVNHPDFHKAPEEFLIRSVLAMPKDCGGSLAIDDFHSITDTQAQKAVLDFLLYLPKGIRICILSRTFLPKMYRGLLLKHKFRFLSQEQLLFNKTEIQEFYRVRGEDLTPEQADVVMSSTEGWPIGVNAVFLSKNKGLNSRITDSMLDDFLESFVWERWDRKLRKFMLQVCMEETLTEPLCRALTGEKEPEQILGSLEREGAFLCRREDGSYRFHKLFQRFLRKRFSAMPEEFRVRQMRRAGKWHQGQNHFCQATERFAAIKDYKEIASCFDMLETVDRAAFDSEQVMYVVRNVLDEEAARQFPHLYYMMAFTARNDGRLQDFRYYADQYYGNYERITQRTPKLAHNVFFLYLMDFRFSVQDIVEMAMKKPPTVEFQGVRGTATLYFPFYHRSFRDFSEFFAGDVDAAADMLDAYFGSFLGEEREMLVECTRAGLYYEKGELQKAKVAALTAFSKMEQGFAPESRFCVFMILMEVYRAMQDYEEAKKIQNAARKMIADEKAFYLSANFHAVTIKNQLYLQDRKAAEDWLGKNAVPISEKPTFWNLYPSMTCARAYMVAGEFDKALVLLEKLLALCKEMRRTIDVIELEILRAVTFEKEKDRKKSTVCLENAVGMAQELELEQVFVNEGIWLEPLLCRLKNWVIRGDYQGSLSETFVKKVYFKCIEQKKEERMRSGYREPRGIPMLTERQKKVAGLMCEGYSYRKIAEKLGIKFSTVRSHIEAIYGKLDVSTMTEAVLEIRKLRLLDE